MRTVLIIGAGGSVAEARSYRPTQKHIHPPLDPDFFAKCERLTEKSKRVTKHLHAFRQWLRRSHGLSDPFGSRTNSMEQFFSDLYYEAAERHTLDATQGLRRLLHLYSTVIADTTNWMAGQAQLGDVDRLLRFELEDAHPDPPTVITFNHDLVIENCVERLLPSSALWCLESLYGNIGFRPLPTEKGRASFSHHSDRCRHTPPISLLKLHGSLNWTICSNAAEAIPIIFPAIPPNAIWLQQRRKVLPGFKPTRSTIDNCEDEQWPLVVPPVYDKRRITGVPAVAPMWEKAEVAIIEAERLILIGYSIPKSDGLVRQMIKRSFAANRHVRVIDVVDPNAEIGAKVQRLVDGAALRRYTSIKKYLAGDSVAPARKTRGADRRQAS